MVYGSEEGAPLVRWFCLARDPRTVLRLLKNGLDQSRAGAHIPVDREPDNIHCDAHPLLRE
jgi:hypothetical protein